MLHVVIFNPILCRLAQIKLLRLIVEVVARYSLTINSIKTIYNYMYFIEGHCDMIFTINPLKIRHSLNINGLSHSAFNL